MFIVNFFNSEEGLVLSTIHTHTGFHWIWVKIELGDSDFRTIRRFQCVFAPFGHCLVILLIEKR
jgi:hypothetical protein